VAATPSDRVLYVNAKSTLPRHPEFSAGAACNVAGLRRCGPLVRKL